MSNDILDVLDGTYAGEFERKEKEKCRRKPGSSNRMSKEEYQSLVSSKLDFLKKNVNHLCNVYNGLVKSPDFSPAILNLLQALIDNSSDLKSDMKELVTAIRKRGSTSFDDQKTALLSGRLKIVRTDNGEEE